MRLPGGCRRAQFRALSRPPGRRRGAFGFVGAAFRRPGRGARHLRLGTDERAARSRRNRYWKEVSQAVVTAIRAAGDGRADDGAGRRLVVGPALARGSRPGRVDRRSRRQFRLRGAPVLRRRRQRTLPPRLRRGTGARSGTAATRPDAAGTVRRMVPRQRRARLPGGVRGSGHRPALEPRARGFSRRAGRLRLPWHLLGGRGVVERLPALGPALGRHRPSPGMAVLAAHPCTE